MTEFSTTPKEFLDLIPKKTKKDHEDDTEEMKKVSEKVKNVVLKPKMDLEEAVKQINAMKIPHIGK
jgi:hypothetical protein